jgi:hypothetical protein
MYFAVEKKKLKLKKKKIVHGTKGHMAVYGPGRHPQNIIWTKAKHILFCG